MSIVEWMSDSRTVVTVVCLLTFLGIVFWTFSGKRSIAFGEAANLPFADEEPDQPAATTKENRNV